jgi:two-component system chemotaxis response regulator CheB
MYVSSTPSVIKVMLVDDSAIIRRLFSFGLEKDPEIKVIAKAEDGRKAIEVAKQHQPDVIVLDIEMPEMDGIEAIPHLLAAVPGVQIIMASTLTQKNAAISLKALEVGAVDYLGKPDALNTEEFYRELREKVKALGSRNKQKNNKLAVITTTPAPILAPQKAKITKPKALAIASSTGGPQAVIAVFKAMKGHRFDIPIFITQHMPPVFTEAFAHNITNNSGFPASEGKDGEMPKAGHIYIAPGGYHMVVKKEGNAPIIRINQDPPVNFCRPAADPMFESLSKIYGADLMAVVLTGMGRDGADGATIIAKNGGTVIAQDEKSCAVYGMPRATAEAGICQAILPLEQIGGYITKYC